jgi:NtrC-family two-component system sensor histidine kinase KinB
LLIFDRVTGVLPLLHRTPGFFKPHYLSLLQNITERMALPIENARLYETVRRRAEEMAALYDVALNISADQPLDRLLNTIVAQAMDLLHCQGGGLFLWCEEEAELELVAAYDPEIDLRGTRVAPGEGLVGRVFETGEPVALDEYGSPAIVSDISSGLSTTAAIAVPLMWQGQPIGVLMTTDRTPGRHFDHSDRHLLTLLANQSAAAIASAQLHEQTSRSLQELTFLNETIQDITATLELDEIFAILTRRVKDLLGIEACSIALVDRETNDLVLHFASGGGAETVKGERVPWGQGIMGAAAQSKRPVNVPDVWQDDRFYKEMDKKQSKFVTQSILAVPMISRGQVAGVVEALNKPGGFNAEDERLLSALASLAASVVENANLFSSVRAAEMRYQALFEDAADAAWVTDTEGKIIQANRKAVALTGHADHTVADTVLWALTLPEECEIWQTALAQAVAGEEPTVESLIADADGIPRPLELRLKRIRADEGFGVKPRFTEVSGPTRPNVTRVQWIGRDISARRELEQLRESLANMLVHDLRSPVGTISSSLGLLSGLIGAEEPHQATQLLDIASRATRRLSNLVNSLLDISQLEAGQELTDRTPVSIKPLIQAAVDQLALYAQRKRMKVNFDLPDRLPLVLADEEMIERVLVNLLDNALKFTPAGGEVSVAVETEMRERLLSVRVRDNGPGILPQYQRRIFDKFAQVRGQMPREGIGLGLAFCRLAVEAHGGRIWVESPSGQGSAFVFTLPLGEASDGSTEPAEA